MVSIEDYGEFESAWCPGCGNFKILEAVKKSLTGQGLKPRQVLFVSGIGQAAKLPHYLNCNFFNGLHGRVLPVVTGAKLANPELKIIAESGDGCTYGEGGNHFMAGIRRNIDVAYLVHNNQIYGLTKGQASPTTDRGHETKAQPYGNLNTPFNPVCAAVGLKVGFVARGFAGEADHLADLITRAMEYKGFALVDILQPCVSFNKVNTFGWYKKRCYKLEDDYDPTDWAKAVEKAVEWGERIPIGVIYRDDGMVPLEERLPGLKDGPLIGRKVNIGALEEIMAAYE